MTAREFSRDAFLKDLDRFYRAIESAAGNTETYKQKQDFINTVYERFFQGYSPKEADTHGIVYTPQPIVDFMVRSVEDILKKEFGRSLSDKDVHILDPFVGTGNFITRVMKEIKTSALPYKYENELHCNEVMLLPYYVASMNIEHEYLERTGEYRAFPGICLVDTFELAEPEQSKLSFMTEENTARVKRQKEAPIFVVIANPPYNMGQVNENDNNKNRHYPVVDERITDTYATESTASNVNKLTDPYVLAIRWASDRLVGDGVVAFVSNNSFIGRLAFDGMRACLETEFTEIFHVDLKGNARTSGERRRQAGGNVFDDAVRVSVGITFFVKNARKPRKNRISLFRVEDFWRAEEKRSLLDQFATILAVPMEPASLNLRHAWITEGIKDDFEQFIPIARDRRTREIADTVFEIRSLGLNTNRDQWVYNFGKEVLQANLKKTISAYNAEVRRWQTKVDHSIDLDSFVDSDQSKIKWSSRLKEHLMAGNFAEYDPATVRTALYRPFNKEFVYLDQILNQRRGNLPRIFPLGCQNSILVISDIGARSAFSAMAADCVVDLHLSAGVDGFSVLPVLRLRRGRLQPSREHYRLGAQRIPDALLRPQHHQVGHLPLRLCGAASSRVPRALRRQPQARVAAHPVRHRRR
jgi:predicted helicase